MMMKLFLMLVCVSFLPLIGMEEEKAGTDQYSKIKNMIDAVQILLESKSVVEGEQQLTKMQTLAELKEMVIEVGIYCELIGDESLLQENNTLLNRIQDLEKKFQNSNN